MNSAGTGFVLMNLAANIVKLPHPSIQDAACRTQAALELQPMSEA